MANEQKLMRVIYGKWDWCSRGVGDAPVHSLLIRTYLITGIQHRQGSYVRENQFSGQLTSSQQKDDSFSLDICMFSHYDYMFYSILRRCETLSAFTSFE